MMKGLFAIFTGLVLLLSVMFVSAGLFDRNKITGQVTLDENGWTPWLNRDDSSGSGDYETLVEFIKTGQSCEHPTSIECQTVNGEKILQNITCNANVGGYCLNSLNSNGCLDYKVRFYCGKEEENETPICGNGILEVGEQCDGTEWDLNATCQYFGYDYGALNCQEGCVFDFSDCANNQTCTDTCSSLGYECGTQTICGVNANCGTCATGEICSSGICVQNLNQTCTDSDGINYYIRGVTDGFSELGERWIKEDKCNELGLFEYFCREDGVMLLRIYNCPNGCLDGVCINEASILETNKNCKENVSLSTDANHLIIDERINSAVRVLTDEDMPYSLSDWEIYEIVDGVSILHRGLSFILIGEGSVEKSDGKYLMKLEEGEVLFTYRLIFKSINFSSEDIWGERIRIFGGEYTILDNSNNSFIKLYSDNRLVELENGRNANFVPGSDGKISKIEIPLIPEEEISMGDTYVDSIFNSIRLDFPSVEGSYVNIYILGDCDNSCFSNLDCVDGEECTGNHCVGEGGENVFEEESCSLGDCPLDGSCVPVCYRNSGEYCSLSGGMIEQLSEGSACDNSCECESNLCVNNQCVSGNLIQRIINWLGSIFGK